ncbi:LysR family transcriptional regulator [Micromonospora sp. R77]|uniref:LysR family transcriptional regulator n=1 Tax=Micromonospora sp. R77 TaxID=2925836 RepID=UPI001F607500|nr:LysR family transcriptional regulator [Micromonospora sp. R77]MCI4066762.1 LysR family transcriptional regulator [Micromonospora sp. R77]
MATVTVVDLDRVTAFVAAAERMNFTVAAEELGLAQPSLSARIRALETEIGAELFSRRRRQVALTPAGKEFLRHARTLLTLAEEAVRETRRAAHPDDLHRLVITTLAAGVDELKAGAVTALGRELPALRVSLTGVSFLEHVSAVREGRAQAGYLWPPYTPAATAGLHLEPVRRWPRLVALPADHPLARRPDLAVAELAGEPQVPLPDGVDPLFLRTWRLLPEPRIGAGEPAVDVGALLRAVAAGSGCCPVPALLARTATAPGVAFVPLRDAPAATLALAWRPDLPAVVDAALRRAARAVV